MSKMLKKIKQLTFLTMGLIPFAFSVFYGVNHSNGIFNLVGLIALGVAATLMTTGIQLETFAGMGDRGAGILVVFSIPIGLIGGIFLLVGQFLI